MSEAPLLEHMGLAPHAPGGTLEAGLGKAAKKWDWVPLLDARGFCLCVRARFSPALGEFGTELSWAVLGKAVDTGLLRRWREFIHIFNRLEPGKYCASQTILARSAIFLTFLLR